MKAREILKADFLDLLFDNRNKSYGAYSLRKTYNKRLVTALGIAFSAAFSAAWFIQPVTAEPAPERIIAVREVVLQHYEEVKPPPPPPPKTEEAPAPEKAVKNTVTKSKVAVPKVKKTRYTPPVIVADKDAKKTEVPLVDEIARVDVIDIEGMAANDLAIPAEPAPVASVGVEDGKGILHVPEEKVYDENTIFEKVEVEARVDQSKWRQHLMRKLVRYIEEAAYAGMPAGQYTVRVRFLVEKDGSIGRVTALNNPGYGLARGAEEVVKSGPKWTAAVQNGRKVRSYHTQPITFMIMES